eukprot:354670-Chlamydomonas_euryale.AAC.5
MYKCERAALVYVHGALRDSAALCTDAMNITSIARSPRTPPPHTHTSHDAHAYHTYITRLYHVYITRISLCTIPTPGPTPFLAPSSAAAQLLMLSSSARYFERTAGALERKAGQEARMLAAAAEADRRRREAQVGVRGSCCGAVRCWLSALGCGVLAIWVWEAAALGVEYCSPAVVAGAKAERARGAHARRQGGSRGCAVPSVWPPSQRAWRNQHRALVDRAVSRRGGHLVH